MEFLPKLPERFLFMILCFGTNMKQYGPFKHSLGWGGTTPHWYGSPGKIIGTVTINQYYSATFSLRSTRDVLSFALAIARMVKAMILGKGSRVPRDGERHFIAG